MLNVTNKSKTLEVTTIEVVRLADMRLDMSYQRSERNTVKEIIKKFDPRLLRPLVVSYRDNVYYIVDGQHRYLALNDLGVESIRCEVFHGLTSKEEAEIFSKQNNNVAKLKPVDTFKSNIHIGDASNIDVIIFNTVKKNEMDFAKHQRSLGFRCLNDLRRAVKLHGSSAIEYLCQVLKKSGWVHHLDAYKRDIQYAIFSAYKANVSVNKVVEIFSYSTPSEFIINSISTYKTAGGATIMRYLESLIK